MNKKRINRIKTAVTLVLFICLLTATALAQEKEEKLVGKTVNINTATAEDLAKVPLITPELARAIVDYRNEVGDFQVIEELLQVEGFTRQLLRRIKPFLLLEGIGGDECTC